MYKELVGGVLAMKPHHYMKANGFSNSFWGWGGEDDDMERRYGVPNRIWICDGSWTGILNNVYLK